MLVITFMYYLVGVSALEESNIRDKGTLAELLHTVGVLSQERQLATTDLFSWALPWDSVTPSSAVRKSSRYILRPHDFTS